MAHMINVYTCAISLYLYQFKEKNGKNLPISFLFLEKILNLHSQTILF